MKIKTVCQGPQDFIKPNSQPCQPVLWLPAGCSPHLPVLGLLPPPYSRQACKDGGFPRVCGLGQDSSPGSYPKLRPWLGSYEGCSFICSPLIHGSLSFTCKPGEDQTKEHTQRHDNVWYVGDDQSSVNHSLQSTCSLFINENTLIEIHHWENQGSDVSCLNKVV